MYISLDKNGRYSGREGHCSHAVARWMPERFRVRRERVHVILLSEGCFSTLAVCQKIGGVKVKMVRVNGSKFMDCKRDRVERVIWRSLGRHVEAGHKLEVRRMPEGGDLEIHCCWCGNTVLAGSQNLVLYIVEALKESGAKITSVAQPV